MANSKLYIGDLNVKSLKLGNTDIKAYLGGTLLYPLSKTIDDAIITCASATYNGSNQIAQNITVTLSEVTLIENTDYIVTQNFGGINAGSYEVVISGIGDYEGTANGTFIINKVTPTVVAPTAKSLTYNGSAQALVNAGSTNWGTLKYSLDGSTYSTSIPSGTNATSYTIYYRVDGDSNINNVTAKTVSVTIAKANGSVTTIPVNNNYTYNGTARAVASAGSGTGTMYYRLGSSGSFSTTMPKMTSAGSSTLYYYAAESTNYNQTNTSSITVSVQKADQSAPTATGATSTYPTTATATASGGGGQGSIEWESSQSQTSVGSHTTRARWSGDSNYNASPWSSYVTIQMNKASRTVTFSNPTTSVDVGGTVTNVATISAGASDGTLTYSSSDTSKATVNSSGTVTGVANGSATITASIIGGTNYADASSSYNISIEGQFEPVVTNYTYTGSRQSVTLQPGTYTFECWGAQGGAGYDSTSSAGGKGGYSKGTLTLNTATTVYVYVGGSGGSSTGQIINGGFNGGGRAYAPSNNYNNGAGGGASDIRIGTDSLYARAIVAGGGGGGGTRTTKQYYYPGGYGGGTNGGTPTDYYQGYGTGGNQSSAGSAMAGAGPVSASFGTGGGNSTSDTDSRCSGGGGGWYGGGGARRGPSGGGSGYVLTSSSYKPSGYLLGSDYYLSDAETKGGNTSFPSTSSGSETGHSGNGYVRITQIG